MSYAVGIIKNYNITYLFIHIFSHYGVFLDTITILSYENVGYIKSMTVEHFDKLNLNFRKYNKKSQFTALQNSTNESLQRIQMYTLA